MLGFTCPNKDGTKGIGGCTYCNNNTFNPDVCKPIKSILTQIDEGIAFFLNIIHKIIYYFHYLNNNTYAPIQKLKKMYREALSHSEIIGLVIATRPDSISNDVLDFLQKLVKEGYFIKLEFGLESTKNQTLKEINRCQTHEDAIDAFSRASNRGLHLGAHLILGLPGESRDDMLQHARNISKLPIDMFLRFIIYKLLNIL